ncbi:MAG: TfoX/Sxy family DNA transformation protein [Maritimibacter sp.]|nr:TfoX/Sxy family DNA transformation protein [Maritimibacter sp.]
MATPISSIRNLGPATERGFLRAGIADAETLRALGPDAAYAKLLASGERPHFIGYYAMVMGLMGRPWNDCRGEEKRALRLRFDAIVAAAKSGRSPADAAIERALDEIGLPAPRYPTG